MRRYTNKLVQTVAFTAVAMLSHVALAAEDASSTDKSFYTLINPTPANQMRSFYTDRPTKSDTPYTVDAGHFQYEADAVNWIYDRYNASHTTTSSFIVGDPVLKAGLTNHTDLELALSPININQYHNRQSSSDTSFAGFGDIYARIKYNFLGNDSGDQALAIVPYVKAPAANQHIGNTHWEGGGYIPFITALPHDWTMNITSEIDFLENADLTGTHTNFSNLINFSHMVFDPSVTGYVEFWSDVNNDTTATTQYTADFALSWVAKDNLQFDVGVNLGLNKAASDVQAYAGIAQRF